MQLLATLVNRQGLSVHLEPTELPNGKVTPPYFLQYKGRIFLIDPMAWEAGSATTPIIASYNEQAPDEYLNVENLKPLTKEAAA